MTQSERKRNTHYTVLREKWNNLNSPANPRNYLHGKILPIGVDEQQNFVYRYNPMPYEEKWKLENIDLTK